MIIRLAISPPSLSPPAQAERDAGGRGDQRLLDPDLVAPTRTGEPVGRPVNVERGHDLAARVGDGGRHRADPFSHLVTRPRDAVHLGVPEPLADLLRVRHRPRDEPLQGGREEPVHLGRREAGQEHEPG